MVDNLSTDPKRVMVLGATGTVGRATVRALVQRGHEVVCFVRRRAGVGGALAARRQRRSSEGGNRSFRRGHQPGLHLAGFGENASTLSFRASASRTGAPQDAWSIDHQAHVAVLDAAKLAGVSHMVLLSAICVQKPLLAFQHAKLAFEKSLMSSGTTYSIVRPTALFKSLSGQIDRLKRGKSFLIFGDGTMTSCKPISDNDLGRYLADCLDDETRHNRVLPIGGTGAAITPKQQDEHLFALLGREPSSGPFRSCCWMRSSGRWQLSNTSFQHCRRRRSWPASGATRPRIPCSSWTPRRDAMMPMPLPHQDQRRCSISMRAW